MLQVLKNSAANINATVYPNPTSGDLNFMINTTKSENIDIILVNTLGQTVRHITKNNISTGFNQITTDVSQLPVGTYFYQIKTDSNSSLKGKVIITK